MRALAAACLAVVLVGLVEAAVLTKPKLKEDSQGKDTASGKVTVKMKCTCQGTITLTCERDAGDAANTIKAYNFLKNGVKVTTSATSSHQVQSGDWKTTGIWTCSLDAVSSAADNSLPSDQMVILAGAPPIGSKPSVDNVLAKEAKANFDPAASTPTKYHLALKPKTSKAKVSDIEADDASPAVNLTDLQPRTVYTFYARTSLDVDGNTEYGPWELTSFITDSGACALVPLTFAFIITALAAFI